MPWPPMGSSGEPSRSSEVMVGLLLGGLRSRIRAVLMAIEVLFAGSPRTSCCHRQGCRQQDGQSSEAFHRHNHKQADRLKLNKRSQKGRFCGETTKRGGTQIRTGAKASKTPKNAHKHWP